MWSSSVLTYVHSENVYHAPEDVPVNLDLDLKNLGLDYSKSLLRSRLRTDKLTKGFELISRSLLNAL